jgi:hypothetical protein
MAKANCVVYYRVLIATQAASSLNHDRQWRQLAEYLYNGNWLRAEITEKKRNNKDRGAAEQGKSLNPSGACGAQLIPRIYRLSRQGHVFAEGSSKSVVPEPRDGNELVVGIMAVPPRADRKSTSKNTLAASKASGATSTGGRYQTALAARQEAAKNRAANLAPMISRFRAAGVMSFGAIARALNKRGVPAAQGGCWTPMQVSRVLRLLDNAGAL